MIHWQSFSDFLAMGGYAGYVWGSFGVTVLILAIEPLLVRRRRKLTVARLKRQQRADARAEFASNSVAGAAAVFESSPESSSQ